MMASSSDQTRYGRPLPEFTYSFKRIPYFPLRLLRPPVHQGAVRVRSFSVIPPLQISLRDVLEGKHFPPLSIADFEDYLRCVERSVENLYFIHWLDDYTAKYQAQILKAGNVHSAQLALSFARAKATFLSPQSILAVNINDDSLSAIIRPQDEVKSVHTYPPPERFAHARREVEDMLRNSLTTFITTRAQGNAGILHILAGLCLGVVCILCGLAVALSQTTQHPPSPKSVRLAAIPCFFVGFCAFIGCCNGVCIIVWFFGEGRQLRDYELARPEISGVVSHTTMMPLQERGIVGMPEYRSADNGKDVHQKCTKGGDDGQRVDEIKLGYPLSLSVTSASATGASSIERERPASPSPSIQSGSSSVTPLPSPIVIKPTPAAWRPPPPSLPIAMSMLPTSCTESDFPAHDQPLTSISLVFDPSDPSPFASSSAAPMTQLSSAVAASGMIPDEPPHPPSATYIPTSNPNQQPQWCFSSGQSAFKIFLSIYRELYPAPGDRRGPRPRPFIERMTPIESSVIQRSNWEVVVRVMAISAILTSALVSLLWFVPTQAKS